MRVCPQMEELKNAQRETIHIRGICRKDIAKFAIGGRLEEFDGADAEGGLLKAVLHEVVKRFDVRLDKLLRHSSRPYFLLHLHAHLQCFA